MYKAEFVSKYYVKQNGRYTGEIEYTYRYRGYEYQVNVNNGKGNEPLSWQHKNAQARIDKIIEIKEKENNTHTDGPDVEDTIKDLFTYWEN